jgi:cytochrome aa3-600 menaquinol oxidase subunit II
MKMKRAYFFILSMIFVVLAGCSPIAVLDPKGAQAKTQANVIWTSIWIMSVICIVVMVLFVYYIIKYRETDQNKNYEPPYIKGNNVVETIIVTIPILIVIFFSIVTVISNNKVEAKPAQYKHQKPLIIYASSSDWKYHFSYPEENIETVNYLNIPTDRPIEFKLYSFGPITSFWIPQLGGQKYAMHDMITTLYLSAEFPGDYDGRNANFSGKGFAENTFSVTAMPQAKYNKWVKDVKAKAKPLTQQKFGELLKPGHVGRSTFTRTHLKFSPPPKEGMDDMKDMNEKNHSSMSNKNE